MSQSATDEIVATNRAYWESLAPHRKGEPLDFFRQGNSALDDHELALIGDVDGLRVLHLACSMGDESLTFAQHGADVTGVDLAPSHLETGRAKAAALGVQVTFVEQDMMRLDPSLTDFDLIYVSSGGVCWIPDLDAWAAQIVDRLVPTGRLVINEHHPLWEVLSVADHDQVTVSGDYFGNSRDGYGDPLKAPQVTQSIGSPDISPQSFVWSLGRIVTALLGAGLTIQALQEYPHPEMYPGLGSAAARLPATYLLSAGRRDS